jgi:cystathionine beta-lyase
MYNFDEIIDRRHTMSLKFDSAKRRGKPEHAYPMWVADMDFRAPTCVADALAARIDHGIYGYSDIDRIYNNVLVKWFKTRFEWMIDPDWNTTTPGVVPALHLAVRAFTQEGDGVLVQPPVYYPFFSAIETQKRALLKNTLQLQDGKYEIDFDDFEQKARRAKLFILCNPHNPVGRVWTEAELSTMGKICANHGVVVVSDEIHADFVFPGNKHTVFSRVEDFSENAVICTSPSKTFNLAGLLHANIIIKNDSMRRKFREECARAGLSHGSVMGMIACYAAYENGLPWLAALLKYMEGNLAMARDFFAHYETIDLIEPQGTYLLWLDCRKTNLSPRAIDEAFLQTARLWLDEGTMFGDSGAGFMRLNMALPREKLRTCLASLPAIDAHATIG